MDKRDYFVEACKAGAYKHRHWIIQMFSTFVFNEEQQLKHSYPFKISAMVKSKEGYYAFQHPESGELTIIKESSADKPIYRFTDKLTLSKGEIPNLNENITTTYGNLLFNWIALVYPFGEKVPYMNKIIKGSEIDKMIATNVVDNPKEGEERDPRKFYIDEVERYMEGMTAIGSLAVLCAPAASPKTMTIDDAVLKRRDELFKEYGDRIQDPAIMAKIEEELANMDRESFKGDPSEKFYIKAKTFSSSRKRCFVALGAEVGFGNQKNGAVVIKKPLSEGWDLPNMPAMFDGHRAGSFKRGAETALGGESVKYFYRVFQNTKVAEEDCGNNAGIPWEVDESNYKQFIGLYGVNNKTTFEITEDNVKQYIGKTIYTRSPLLCVTQAPSFCAKCIGKALASSPTGLHNAASNVGSSFMSASLAAAHGRTVRTEQFLYDKHIT